MRSGAASTSPSSFGIEPGQRVLDLGCCWGSRCLNYFLMHPSDRVVRDALPPRRSSSCAVPRLDFHPSTPEGDPRDLLRVRFPSRSCGAFGALRSPLTTRRGAGRYLPRLFEHPSPACCPTMQVLSADDGVFGRTLFRGGGRPPPPLVPDRGSSRMMRRRFPGSFLRSAGARDCVADRTSGWCRASAGGSDYSRRVRSGRCARSHGPADGAT